MSKRKGPVLINDLLSKISKQTAPRESVSAPAPSLESAKSAYQFISESYKAEDKQGSSIDSAHSSNQVQIGSKSGSNQVQKPVQIGFKSNSVDISSKQPPAKSGSETGSTLVQIGSKSGSNQVQKEPSAPSSFEVLTIRGSQRQILDLLFSLSLNSGDRATPYLSSSEIGKALQMPQESVRTALKRLLLRGVLLRKGFQRGRTGWSCYELSQKAYRDLREIGQSGSNWVQNGFKSGSEIGSQTGSTASSSSSYVLEENLKTTTSDSELFENPPTQLAPEWQQLDISPLDPIGFTNTHLVQIIRQGKLSVDEVQDSINFYAFDLNRNGLKPKSALNYFMGVVRRGIPYGPQDNYETPADEVRRKTREFKERQAAMRQAEEQKILDLEFQEWRRGLSSDEVQTLVPEFARRPGPVQESSLKTYFQQNLWPDISAKMAGLTTDRLQIRQEIEQSLVGEGRG